MVNDIKFGIAIAHHRYTDAFFHDLMDSLSGCRYPIIIFDNNIVNRWELGVIKEAAEIFDEFVFLQDSCFVKALGWLYRILEQPGSVAIYQDFNAYLGKYDSRIIRDMPIEPVRDKADAVSKERWFSNEILRRCNYRHIVCFPDEIVWHGSPNNKPRKFLEKHGRVNAVYESEFFIKYKECFCMEVLQDKNYQERLKNCSLVKG